VLFPPLSPPDATDVPRPPFHSVVESPTRAATTATLPGASESPLSCLQPSASGGKQSLADACAATTIVEFIGGASDVAGLVCAPAIAAYKLTAAANTALRVPNVSATPFCVFISFS
jgi:hypothetical protein